MDPTPRQLQCLAEVAVHGSVKSAAGCMGISVQTVKNSLCALHIRLGTTSGLQTAAALGWLSIPDGTSGPHEQDAGIARAS